MKKTGCAALALLMVLSLCACGSSSTGGTSAAGSNDAAPANDAGAANGAAASPAGSDEEDSIDDSAWDELESLGKIETENGLFYVSITLPAEFIGSDAAQESIDADAGETYTSGS